MVKEFSFAVRVLRINISRLSWPLWKQLDFSSTGYVNFFEFASILL